MRLKLMILWRHMTWDFLCSCRLEACYSRKGMFLFSSKFLVIINVFLSRFPFSLSVVFVSLALMFYPLGLNSSFARTVCGSETNMYRSGNCQIAWGYVLSIMSASLLIFSPILARYSIERKEQESRPQRGYHVTNMKLVTAV